MAGNIRTLAEMKSAGYKFRNLSKCKGCQVAIEWWTTTNNKLMPYPHPMPADEHTLVEPHWATCPNRKDFKSKADQKVETSQARAAVIEGALELTGARAILALYPEGPIITWMTGVDAEEIRDEAIAAANKLRWKIRLGLEKQA